MVVCQFFLKGQCRFGDACRNQHPASFGAGAATFGAGAASGSGNETVGTTGLLFSTDSIRTDLTTERPLYTLSCYGPGKAEPNLLAGVDFSPEELRLQFYKARQANNEALYPEKEMVSKVETQVQTILSNINQAYQFALNNSSSASSSASTSTSTPTSAFGATIAPARNPFGTVPASTPVTSNPFATPSKPSAFGSGGVQGAPTGGFGAFAKPTFSSSPATAFGSTAPAQFGSPAPAFGTPAFGSSPGAKSAFGAPTVPAAFGAPSFGASASPFASNPASSGGFGAFVAGGGARSAFGAGGVQGLPAPSQAFGQSTTPAFGQTTTPAFGQTTVPAFGQTTAPAFGQPATSAFGQASTPAFGQVTTSAVGQSTPSAFGQSTPQPSQPSAFGTFAQPQPQQNAFGAFNRFGAFSNATGQQSPATTSAFGGGGFATNAPTQNASAFTQFQSIQPSAPPPQQSGFGAFGQHPQVHSAFSPQMPASTLLDPYAEIERESAKAIVWTDAEKAAWAAESFTWGQIPTRAPPLEMR